MNNIDFPAAMSGNTMIIRPTGYLNTETCLKLKLAIQGEIKNGCRQFLLNLAKVTVINSPGITQLLEIAEEVICDHKGRLAFAEVSQLYQEVFQVIGLNRLVDIYDNEQEALADF